MSIDFNFSYMLSKFIGNNGIKNEHIEKIREKFSNARISLQEGKVSGKYGFMSLPFDEETIKSIVEYANKNLHRYKTMLVFGIGGSALGTSALINGLLKQNYNHFHGKVGEIDKIFVFDNVDPEAMQLIPQLCSLKDTLCVFVSKSGSTAETLAQLAFMLPLMQAASPSNWQEYFLFITDPDVGPLRALAKEHGIKTFDVPKNVGGRFSVLSSVGLVPAAFGKIDIEALCEGARSVFDQCFNDKLEDNPAAAFAAMLYLADTELKRPIQVMYSYSQALYLIADWFRQLWAESLGKRYSLSGEEIFVGPTPVKALGATDQHSQVQLYLEGPQDKVVIFLGTRKFRQSVEIPPSNELHFKEFKDLIGVEMGQLLIYEKIATQFALIQANRPTMSIEFDEINAHHIGGLMFILEVATLYAAAFYNINALDQPGVEAGKIATYALLGREGFAEMKNKILNKMSSREFVITSSFEDITKSQ